MHLDIVARWKKLCHWDCLDKAAAGHNGRWQTRSQNSAVLSIDWKKIVVPVRGGSPTMHALEPATQACRPRTRGFTGGRSRRRARA
jgi:hypothetical protein